MPSIRFTYGLDFGTSKTAITSARTETINPQIVDVAVDIHESERMPTCLLRDASRDPPRVYIGSIAEQQYLLSQNDQQPPRFEFFSNFKPHIHQNAERREIALEFLREFRRTERLSEMFLRNAHESVIAVGCPVSWVSSGVETLLKLLRDAEFPPAFAIPEPVGAAFYFLGTSQLGAQDFHNDIVVFDWGAGTFDMTTLRAGRMDIEETTAERANQVPMTWGSTLYGGRIFDDLFYQWLIDMAATRGRQGDLERLANAPIDRAVLRGLTCRKIKEGFSRHHSSKQSERPWTWGQKLIFGADEDAINLGDFAVAGGAEFDERMRSYKASAEARVWLDLASAEAQPEEREFVEALRNGQPVDLKAWGTRLIETGLQKLAVGDEAIAILTGGSCNWKWFIDHVRSIPPFAGRATAVVRDDKPELTIARGLARAYAVGSYTKRLVNEVKSKRDVLAAQLTSIHREMLENLSYQLTAEMKLDDKLKADLTEILKQGLARAKAERSGAGSVKDRLTGFWDALRKDPGAQAGRIVDALRKDPAVETIRPDLEQRMSRWLAENRKQLDRWATRFSIEANRRVMTLLKEHINAEISGLVEVAIEACGATGQTPFDQALKALGGKVAFEPNVIARIYKDAAEWISRLVSGTRGSSPDDPSVLAKEAEESTIRFFEAMPAAIRKNIANFQPQDYWARQVIGDLIRTLETLVRVARVDQAERVSGLSVL
jgi:hypothetical protein